MPTSNTAKKGLGRDGAKGKKKLPKPKKLSIIRQSMLAEKYSTCGVAREACLECGLYKVSGEKWRMPRVPEDWTGEMAVVTTGSENAAERNIIRRAWRKGGWEDKDVAVIPAVRCSDEPEPSMKQVRACRPYALHALQVLNPTNVLAVGSTALQTLRNNGEKNITKNRGKSAGPVLYNLPSEPSAGGKLPL